MVYGLSLGGRRRFDGGIVLPVMWRNKVTVVVVGVLVGAKRLYKS